MRPIRLLSVVLVLLFAVACEAEDGVNPIGGDTLDPGGTNGDRLDPISVTPPAGCSLETPAEDFRYPGPPHGRRVGDTFPPLVFSTCEGENVPFAEVIGGAHLTLVTVSAGWCSNCIHETRAMEQDFHAPYCTQGLRILQILTEDHLGNPASPTFCGQWRARYGLTFPVVPDPNAIAIVLDTEELPLHLLVDGTGTIRLRSTGRMPTNMHAEIERLLR